VTLSGGAQPTNEEPDLTEVVEAVARRRRNYRKPLPGKDSHPEPVQSADRLRQDILEEDGQN